MGPLIEVRSPKRSIFEAANSLKDGSGRSAPKSLKSDHDMTERSHSSEIKEQKSKGLLMVVSKQKFEFGPEITPHSEGPLGDLFWIDPFFDSRLFFVS